MHKIYVLTGAIFSLFAVLNFVAYITLSYLGVVEERLLSYLFLLGYVFCVWVPFFFVLIFRLRLHVWVLVVYHLFLIISIIIGSLWRLYLYWKDYDIVVHFLSGVLISFIAYSIFVSSSKNKTSKIWLFVITLSIVMLCGGVWEIWEFSTDILLDNDGQETKNLYEREAVKDTMFDLICDFSGGVLGSCVVLFLTRKNQKNHIRN